MADMSQYNNCGGPEMERWTAKQPDRTYQFSVEPEGIAAYLRVRAGQTKAGRGVYERRRPFVHARAHGVDGTLAVMNKEVDFVDGFGKGLVRIEGSPEDAANLNDYMMRVQGLLTGRTVAAGVSALTIPMTRAALTWRSASSWATAKPSARVCPPSPTVWGAVSWR